MTTDASAPDQVPDPVKDTRQPVVTSLGIILGFLLNFLAQWAVRDDGEAVVRDATDWVIVITMSVAITLMIVVLFRTLSAAYEVADSVRRYRLSFRMYVVAISLVFLGMGVSLFV
ncbi:hypothetical protein ACQEVB_25930 [Pseudonocardia sp. CA-107938]|uniref:hypothetical protein n=1 Tax=Pseudonocardia sp. CA-107938 TaxID=3240021 RepID=UPI003D8FD046